MNQSTIYGISMRPLPADFRSAYGESFRSRRAFRRHTSNRRYAEPSNPRACRGRFDSHSEARLQIRQSAFPVRDCETRCQLDAISCKYLVWPLRKAASKTAFSIPPETLAVRHGYSTMLQASPCTSTACLLVRRRKGQSAKSTGPAGSPSSKWQSREQLT